MYQYVDTNGNTYRISPATLSYHPVSARMSSSGYYDGGDAAEKPLEAAQFQEIQNRIDALFSQTDLHLPNRVKPSAMVRRFQGDFLEAQAILPFSARLRQELESLLRKLIEEN